MMLNNMDGLAATRTADLRAAADRARVVAAARAAARTAPRPVCKQPRIRVLVPWLRTPWWGRRLVT